MKEFDRWLQRIFLVVIFVAAGYACLSNTKIFFVPLLMGTGFLLLYLFVIITGRNEWSWRWMWWSMVLEVVTVFFVAVGINLPALLVFIPLQMARMPVHIPKSRFWWQRLTILLPFLPAALSLFFLESHGVSVYILSALAGSSTAFYTLLILKEEDEKRIPLKQSLASKEAILSTLSHEVRTPLTVIQSTIDIMNEGRTGMLTPQQQQFLNSVGSNVRRLVSLSDTILASIKVESDWFTVNLHPIDIRRVIKNVAVHMKPVLEEKNQSLRYAFPNLLSRPLADENWIHQVLVNLVHNAVKHLQRGGAINISVNENEQGLTISVSDNGCGIKTKERLKVFDEYFQGDAYSVTNLDGAGLGLSIVKRVIEKHNGRIYFGSVKGLGTTVVFTLPTEKGMPV